MTVSERKLSVYSNRRYPEFVIHSTVRLPTDQQPLPKPVLHTGRSSASSSNSQYSLFSFTSFRSCLRLLLPLPATLSFHLSSIQPHVLEGSSNVRCDQSSHPSIFLCWIFFSSLALCNTISLLTRSVQLIFSSLLQHHIADLSRYLRSTFRSVHFQRHTRLCSIRSTLVVSSLMLSPISNHYLKNITKLHVQQEARPLGSIVL
jgi:hypothetical protein